MAFSQQGPRAVCILSANGAVSTVTLRQPSTSGGTVTYEVWHFLCHVYVEEDADSACLEPQPRFSKTIFFFLLEKQTIFINLKIRLIKNI